MAVVSIQKLHKECDSELDMALKYYSILSSLNGLNLPKRQIELLAFTAIRGTITPLSARQEFTKLFKSSTNTVANLKGDLVKKGLMVKVKDMYRVKPSLVPNFSNSKVILEINIERKEEKVNG